MRWRHLRLRGAVHLISRLRRQLPLIGEAIECASPKPPLSGEVARRNAETERSYQICSNLSVSLRLTAPLRGEPFPLRRENNPSVSLRLTAPLCKGSLGAYKTIKIQCKKVQTGKSSPHLLYDCKYSKATAHKLGVPYQAARSKISVR